MVTRNNKNMFKVGDIISVKKGQPGWRDRQNVEVVKVTNWDKDTDMIKVITKKDGAIGLYSWRFEPTYDNPIYEIW
jgi:hypothetical protein